MSDRLKGAMERNSNIALGCSGELGYFALDDCVCAVYLAIDLQAGYPHCLRALPAGKGRRRGAGGIPLHLHESVDAAMARYEAYKPPKILDHCDSAQSVFQAGLIEDPYFCMQVSKSTSIPMVAGREEETGLLVVERV